MTSRRLRIARVDRGQGGDGRVALAAPDVVLGAVEVARRPGVTDDEREVGRQRDRPPVERPAIEQDRRALDAARRRRTGPSARSGPRRSRSRRAGRAARAGTRSTSGAASSRRAQAAASSIAADDERPALGGRVEAMTPRRPVRGRPASVERPGRARDVVEPRAGLRARLVEVEAIALAAIEPHELDPPVVGREVGDPDLEVDGGREDEALVVVGVLADQVDPARGADDADVARVVPRPTARPR